MSKKTKKIIKTKLKKRSPLNILSSICAKTLIFTSFTLLGLIGTSCTMKPVHALDITNQNNVVFLSESSDNESSSEDELNNVDMQGTDENEDYSDSVATINGKQYNSLKNAIKAAKNGDTIVIENDITLNHQITINKNITIVARNKKTIERDTSYKGSLFKLIGCTLNIGNNNVQNCLIIDGNKIKGCDPLIFGSKCALNIKNTKICNNLTESLGGAIFIKNGKLNLSGQTDIYGNSAKFGGALACIIKSQLSITDNVKIHNNNATLLGGAIVINSSKLDISGKVDLYSNFSKFGGAISCYDKSNLSISNDVKIHNNMSRASGSAIHVGMNSNLNLSGQVKFYKNYSKNHGTIFCSDNSNLNIKGNVNIIDNISQYGAAICFFSNGKFHISEQVEIAHNSAKYGGAIFLVSESQDLSITDNVKIHNNKARRKAGAIYLYKKEILKISKQVEFFNNTSLQYAGAILCAHNSKLLITDKVKFHNNIANIFGGAVSCVNNSELVLTDKVKFYNNKAEFGGGAISIDHGSEVSLFGKSELFSNFSKDGGAIIILNGKLNVLEQSDIHHNKALLHGCGIFSERGILNIPNINLVHNNGESNIVDNKDIIDLISDGTDTKGNEFFAQIRTLTPDDVTVFEEENEEDIDEVNENDFNFEENPFEDSNFDLDCEEPKVCNICLGELKVGDRVFECCASNEDNHIAHLSCLLNVENHFNKRNIKCPVCENIFHLHNDGNINTIDENIYIKMQ